MSIIYANYLSYVVHEYVWVRVTARARYRGARCHATQIHFSGIHQPENTGMNLRIDLVTTCIFVKLYQCFVYI